MKKLTKWNSSGGSCHQEEEVKQEDDGKNEPGNRMRGIQIFQERLPTWEAQLQSGKHSSCDWFHQERHMCGLIRNPQCCLQKLLSELLSFLLWMTNLPKKDQTIIITVASEPRFDGERNPSNANTIVRKWSIKKPGIISGEFSLPRVAETIAHNWEPFPTMTASKSGYLGGRKTSPATSFQPQSSCTSSCNKHKRMFNRNNFSI